MAELLITAEPLIATGPLLATEPPLEQRRAKAIRKLKDWVARQITKSSRTEGDDGI